VSVRLGWAFRATFARASPARRWPTISPNATCATALIDRVVHHADVIAIEGDSYRAREADSQAKERRSGTKDPPEPELTV
jgi:hypothetical protein